MPRKFIILTVVILFLLGVGVLFAMNQKSDTNPYSTTPATDNSSGQAKTTPQPAATSPQTATTQDPACPASDSPEITYSAGGDFTPTCVTVKAGTAVKWKNESGSQIQIGADPHPTHTGNREVTGGAFTLDIAAGGTATSTLTTPGDHGFHNHLNPSATGKIVVN